MRNTMEEKVMGLQQFKLDMANAVVNQVIHTRPFFSYSMSTFGCGH